MIRSAFLRNENGFIGFEAKGHAEYAEYGADIVCAAVSGILITAVRGLQKVACAFPETQQNQETGYLKAVVSPDLEDEKLAKVQVILETARLGLLGIKKQYPDFVRVHMLRRR